MGNALDGAIDALVASHNPNDLVTAFAEFDRLRAQLTHAVSDFDSAELWRNDGATSMTAWLRCRARHAPATAATFVSQARRLRRFPSLEGAYLDGDLSADQVRAVLANVSPQSAAAFAEAEGDLVPILAALSVDETVFAMRQWAARAKAQSGDGPEPAPPTQSAHLSQLFDSSWRLDADFSPEGGALVDKAIREAITDDVEGEPTRTVAQRRGDALVDVCRWFLGNRERRRRARRYRPHLNVVVTLEELITGQPGRLDDGTVLDGATIRRMACDAGIHRLVTDGRSQILDHGTETRVVSDALFQALVLRDAHCRFPGCDRVPEWCEAHHVVPVFATNGPTCLSNLVLLCSRHHHICHLEGWLCQLLVDGTFEVTTRDGRCFRSAPSLELRLGLEPSCSRSKTRAGAAAQGTQRGTGQPERGPLVLTGGAERPVEPDGWFVPVEDGPLESSVPVGHADPGQLRQQRLAMAVASALGQHEEVLQVHAMHPEPGREVAEPQGEPDHLPVVVLRYQCEGRGLGSEEGDPEVLLGGHRLLRRSLVLCQRPDQRDDGG